MKRNGIATLINKDNSANQKIILNDRNLDKKRHNQTNRIRQLSSHFFVVDKVKIFVLHTGMPRYGSIASLGFSVGQKMGVGIWAAVPPGKALPYQY